MQFSLIEARIILARMMQRFTFRLHKDAQVKENFKIFIKLSNVWVTAHDIQSKLKSTTSAAAAAAALHPPSTPSIATTATVISTAASSMSANIIEPHVGKINIFFGSNKGTCEEVAEKLDAEAKRMGFDSARLESLDDAVAATEGGCLFGDNTDVSVSLIVTSTYNGQPPDNARKFANYIASRSRPLFYLPVRKLFVQ